MTAITIVLAAIAATLAAGVWVLHHHLRRIAAALQPPTAEPLGIDVDRLHEWQGDVETWRAVSDVLGDSATDMERTPS